MKIAIGVPTNRGVKSKTVESLLKLDIPYDKEVFMATEGYTTAENRNWLAFQAINAGCTHILMVDDDMIFPPDTLTRLLAHDKSIVGVNSNSRKLPLQTTVEPFEGEELGGFQSVMAVGGGVLLIDLNVFHGLEQPWFAVEEHPNGQIKVGEDSYFCYGARKIGYEIYCDSNIEIKHIGDYEY